VYTLHDLSFTVHPEWTPEGNRTACFSGVFNASLFADHIIAVSNYTRQHFLEVFPHYPHARVSVVHAASRFAGPTGAPQPEAVADLQSGRFWLCVGTLEPRKNHVRLLEAYARLRSELGDDCYPLVLAGGNGWLMDGLEDQLKDFGLTTRDVVRLGYVDDASLAWLYENCFVFCYLSSFEGFGLPVVEAMSLGAAVLTSNTTSLPEIVGSAGVMVDPHDVERIFQAMLRLARNPAEHQTLREGAQRRAAEFSWLRAATQVRDIYTQVASRPAMRS
jgi:glycosyltransferase involved in cell wall biosynthesis